MSDRAGQWTDDSAAIVAIEATRRRVRLIRTFTTATRSTDWIDAVDIAIRTSDGRTGLGSTVGIPAVTGQSASEVVAIISERWSPCLVGMPVSDALRFPSITGIGHDELAAWAGIDLSLHARTGALDGGTSPVETVLTLSCDTPEAMASAARLAIRHGHKSVKLKLGIEPDLDARRIQAVAAAAPGVAVWFDANQAWTTSDALRMIDVANSLDLDLDVVEQPVASDDLTSMAEIVSESSARVLADESVRSMSDLERVADLGAAHAVNIKLLKCGGLSAATQLADAADRLGLGVRVGSMMETTSSLAYSVRFAASLPTVVHDLDAGQWVRDPSPLRYRNGTVQVLPPGADSQ